MVSIKLLLMSKVLQLWNLDIDLLDIKMTVVEVAWIQSKSASFFELLSSDSWIYTPAKKQPYDMKNEVSWSFKCQGWDVFIKVYMMRTNCKANKIVLKSGSVDGEVKM